MPIVIFYITRGEGRIGMRVALNISGGGRPILGGFVYRARLSREVPVPLPPPMIFSIFQTYVNFHIYVSIDECVVRQCRIHSRVLSIAIAINEWFGLWKRKKETKRFYQRDSVILGRSFCGDSLSLLIFLYREFPCFSGARDLDLLCTYFRRV